MQARERYLEQAMASPIGSAAFKRYAGYHNWVVNELKKGRVEFRADKTGVIHLAVGKVSMDSEKIVENISTFLGEMMRKKPQDAKADFVRSVSVNSTMGPGVWVSYRAGE